MISRIKGAPSKNNWKGASASISRCREDVLYSDAAWDTLSHLATKTIRSYLLSGKKSAVTSVWKKKDLNDRSAE